MASWMVEIGPKYERYRSTAAAKLAGLAGSSLIVWYHLAVQPLASKCALRAGMYAFSQRFAAVEPHGACAIFPALSMIQTLLVSPPGPASSSGLPRSVVTAPCARKRSMSWSKRLQLNVYCPLTSLLPPSRTVSIDTWNWLWRCAFISSAMLSISVHHWGE